MTRIEFEMLTDTDQERIKEFLDEMDLTVKDITYRFSERDKIVCYVKGGEEWLLLYTGENIPFSELEDIPEED